MKTEQTIKIHIDTHQRAKETALNMKDELLVGMHDTAIHILKWVLEDD